MDSMIIKGSDQAVEILAKAGHKTAFDETPEDVEKALAAAKKLADDETAKAKLAEKGKASKAEKEV